MTDVIDLTSLIRGVEKSLGVTSSEVEKQASTSASAEDSLEEMLDKSASQYESQANGETSEMSKSASNKANGIALADEILAALTKQANSVVDETAVQVANDDAKVLPNPIQEQTVTEVLKNQVLRAISEGAARTDAAVDAPEEAAVEGDAQVPGTEAVEANDEVEKAAAVSHLVSEGVSFDDAVNLVKEASEQLQKEAMEMAKVAALNVLVTEHGVGLEDALAMVTRGAADVLAGKAGK